MRMRTSLRKVGCLSFIILGLCALFGSEDGLIGYWNFEEGSGSVALDRSGNGHDGELVNGPIWSNGAIGGGLLLDGKNDYVRVSDSPDLDPVVTQEITLAAWIKIEGYGSSYGGVYGIVGKASSPSRPRGAYLFAVCNWFPPEKQGKLRFGIHDDVYFQDVFSNREIPTGRWVHVAVTKDKQNVCKFYIDGTLDSVDSSTITEPFHDTALNLVLGYTGSYSDYLPGYIDEIRIYNRALSASEIELVSARLVARPALEEPCKVVVSVDLLSPHPVAAFSFGLGHDCAGLCLGSIEKGQGLVGLGIEPTIWITDTNPISCNESCGAYVAAVMSVGEPLITLPANTQIEIARFFYRPKVAGDYEIAFEDECFGDPPVKNELTIVKDGVSAAFYPLAAGCRISATICFIRGDSNNDGQVSISDAVAILYYLFGGQLLSCVKAADVNDDGVVEIVDSIALIDYLFRGGVAPKPPFPQCGVDPSSDELSCYAPCGGCSAP